MKIRRVRIAMPVRLKGTAAADARQIAEAVARALEQGGTAPIGPLRIDGAGRSGAALALEVRARMRPPLGSRSRNGEG